MASKKPTEETALVKVPAKAEQLAGEARPLVVKANNFQITDENKKVQAIATVQSLQDIRKGITETFLDPVKKMKEAFEAVKALRDKFLNPVESAITILRGKIGAWETDQAAIRRKAEQAQEEARQKAEWDAEEKRRKLLDAGRVKAAANVVAKEVPPPTVVLPAPKKVEGTTMRTDWKWKIVHEDLIPEEYWIRSLDTTKIGQVVRALKQDAKIPGVEVFSVETPVFGSRF